MATFSARTAQHVAAAAAIVAAVADGRQIAAAGPGTTRRSNCKWSNKENCFVNFGLPKGGSMLHSK